MLGILGEKKLKECLLNTGLSTDLKKSVDTESMSPSIS